MKLHHALLVVGLLLSSTSFAALTSNSGEDTIRVISHTGDVTIDGSFAKTTISLTFANRGQQKEGAIYQFSTDYGASVTNLEIKIGKTWQKGVLLESNQARAAYSAITGLDATPRNIDPGLITKDTAGAYTLYAYPVPPGGTLEAKLTIVSRVQFDGSQYYYSYPDAGDETVATPKLNVSILPPTGRTIASATYLEQEAKLITGKTLATQLQLKSTPTYGGPGVITWTLKPPSAAIPAPVVEMYTAAGTKGDSLMFLNFSLDALTPAQQEMGDASAYTMMAITYDTALPEGSFCAGAQLYYLDPGTSYWLACWMPGAAPKSSQTYLNKDGASLDKPISSTARSLDATTLAAVYLGEIEDNYFFEQLMTKAERESYTEVDEAKAKERFFTVADRYNVVTTMTSLLAIDPSDEFSRDVVAFAKKWGSRYAAQMLYSSQWATAGTSGVGTLGLGSDDVLDRPLPKAPASKGGAVGDKPLPLDPGPKFYNPFEVEPPKSNISLTTATPSKVISGTTADRDKIVAVINASPLWGKCMKGLKLDANSALQLQVKDGLIVGISFFSAENTNACSGVLQLLSLPKVSVEFVSLLSALPGKQ